MNRLLPQKTIRQLKRQRRPKLMMTSVKLPRTLALRLKAEARKQDRSQSWVIIDALQSYLTFRQVKEKTE